MAVKSVPGGDQLSSFNAHSPARARSAIVAELLPRIYAQPGLTLLVDGAAGTGKTYFLRSLVTAATEEGSTLVSFVRADEIESGEPYSFMERFVASSMIDDWHFVPDEHTQPVTLARECVRRLVVEQGSPRRLIVIDDAQWIDADSQRVLRYLIPRVTRRGVTLAFGVRTPHAGDSFGEFLLRITSENPLDEHIAFHPFTVQNIVAYTLERVGVGISTQTAQHLLEETGGLFFGLETVLSLLTEDEVSQLHFAWDPPVRSASSRTDPLLRRFAELTPTAQRTVEIVCLAGHEMVANDLQAVGVALGESLALREAVDADTLTETGFGSSIMPRHTLFAQAVNSTVSADRAREVYLALASVTTGYRSLRHTLRGSSEWDDDLRDRVAEFVHDATERGMLTNAVDVLRAALDVADTSDARAELLESLAVVHLRGKNGYLMLDLLPEIEALPFSIFHEFLVIVLDAHRVNVSIDRAQAQRLLMTPPSSPDEQAILGFFAFMAVMLTMRSRDRDAVPQLIEHAKSIITQGPHNGAELKDSRLAWMVDREGYLLVLDTYSMVHDQFLVRTEQVREALPALLERLDGLPDSALKVDAAVSLAGAKLAIGDVEGGRRLAQFGCDLLERVSEPWAASTARLILADSLVLQGAYGEAADLMALTEDLAYKALDVETRSIWAALRVFIAAVTGGDRPDAHIEHARRQKDVTWEGYSPDLALIAECELGRVRGDHGAVLDASSGRWAENLANTRHGFLTYRAHALISLGQRDEAVELVDQLASWRGTRWQEYWGTVDWLRARLAEAAGDAQAARWHYEAAIDQQDYPLPYGLTLADYGEFLVGQGDDEVAAEILTRSWSVLDELGAAGYLPRLEALRARFAPDRRSPHNAGHLFAQLTARERQIVDHLIKGRSNSQIAESLVVSVTTVRSHVSNVLRKLRITSRGEVARLYRASDGTA